MKLRNKKTGEIREFDRLGGFTLSDDYPNHYLSDKTYDTLADFNEEWEDYKPAEPLIKDEKICKAVRAWAEANNRDSFLVINEHFNCCRIIGYTDGGNASCDKIEFGTTIAGADKNHHYTLAELCGEEE